MNLPLQKIKEILQPYICDYGAELVDVELRGKRGRWLLRIFVDMEGGITLQDCTRLLKKFMEIPALEEILGSNYRLEVSSPGVDRPLVKMRDFQRNLGREVRIQYNKGRQIEGEISRVTEDYVVIRNKSGESQIPLSSIIKGKIKLKWE